MEKVTKKNIDRVREISVNFGKAFQREDYHEARVQADLLLMESPESELRSCSYLCSKAYMPFHNLLKTGRRKTAEQLVGLFPECKFQYWLNETQT